MFRDNGRLVTMVAIPDVTLLGFAAPQCIADGP